MLTRTKVTGIQYHILARLFLAQFDPTVPRVGVKRSAAMKRVTVSTPPRSPHTHYTAAAAEYGLR